MPGSQQRRWDVAPTFVPANKTSQPAPAGNVDDMIAHVVTNRYLWMAFITTILLTGSILIVRDQLLEGIRSLDIAATPDEQLLQTIVFTAMDQRLRSGRRQTEEMAQVSSLLPVELQRVLHLPVELRQCFVLRLLMAMPREFCARLLGLDVGAVDRDTGLAAQALAQIVQAEKAAE